MARAVKDSGVAWIGEIPEGWGIGKTSMFFNIQLGKMLQPESSSATDSYEYYLCAANLGGNALKLNPLKQMWFSINDKEQFAVKKGDLLVVEGGDVASCDVVREEVNDLYIQNALHRVRSKSGYSVEYLRYLLMIAKASGHIDLICNKATIAHFTKDKFGSLPFIISSVPEQSRIASFLDHRCAEIDHVMEQTRETIEEYKRLKQSIITEAVTHGIRPGRKMKDSGVRVIGLIPDEWKIMRLKYLTSEIVDCPHETPNYSSEGEYLVIRTADQDYAMLRSDDEMYRLDKEEYENRTRRLSLDRDDIVYGREGERWGLASLVPESGKYCLGQRMMQFRCDTSLISPKFALYGLSSVYVRRQGELDTFGSTSPHVNISTIRNYSIPTPEIDEQVEIADYLDHRCAEIDRLISAKQQLLSQLEAYKKSVIYEYVTGKREVPQ